MKTSLTIVTLPIMFTITLNFGHVDKIQSNWFHFQSFNKTLTYKLSRKSVTNTEFVMIVFQGVSPSESVVVWGEVSDAILKKDWERSSQAKRRVEDTARRLDRERNDKGEVWIPKHFSLSQDKNGSWECSPLEKSVPPAPIIVPSWL